MDQDGDLFNIDVGSSDESTPPSPKLPRNHQTEADFLSQKASWKPKIEQGEVNITLVLPIDNPSKPESESIKHAIEELFFFGRHVEAVEFVDLALRGNLNEDFRSTLNDYRGRCQAKIDRGSKP